MNRLIVNIMLMVSLFFCLPTESEFIDVKLNQPVLFTGTVEHFFTHELVYDIQKANHAQASIRACFDRDHLTAIEFSRLLNELYSNDWILISLDDYVDFETLQLKPLYLPKGKKPFTLSFDDMTYDTINLGCINKLVLTDSGEIADYTKGASPQISTERENLPILEKFIEEHPDFCHDGARATICVNGYNGILGYRITPLKEVSEKYRNQEIEAIKPLISKLKEKGYLFASHSYYHKFFNSISKQQVEKDTSMWKKYVEPVVGKTKIFCYPGGVHKAGSANNEVLKQNGYNVFLCVGVGATKEEIADNSSMYIYRRPFDGTALRIYKDEYKHIVNTFNIYDHEHRYKSFSYKGGYS